MIIKSAQHGFVDVWDDNETGWKKNHTRVQVKKRPGHPLHVYYVSGNKLPHIRYVEIAKTIEAA